VRSPWRRIPSLEARRRRFSSLEAAACSNNLAVSGDGGGDEKRMRDEGDDRERKGAGCTAAGGDAESRTQARLRHISLKIRVRTVALSDVFSPTRVSNN
jgi:hypothetical protein